MELVHEQCYRAVRSRDVRFDGRFYTGVRTTGIYCRPVCPAPAPKPENIDFYPSAAAAEEAGFRPCKRCRPDSLPGTPAWNGTSATVTRALRLIAGGALDDGGIEELAGRLGVGDRQLRRLFLQHVGASPVAVNRSRRAHFAKTLLEQTSLRVTEIAFAAGYASVRSFNDHFKRVFRATPSEVRVRESGGAMGGARGEKSRGATEPLALRLTCRDPIDWPHLAGYFETRRVPGVETVTNGAYHRVITADDKTNILTVRMAKDGVRIELDRPGGRDLMKVCNRVRNQFDLDANPKRVEEVLAEDPFLAESVAAHPGMRVPGAYDPFELILRAIVGQQISVKGTTTILGRIVEAHGEPLDPGLARDGLTHKAPTPETLAGANLDGLGMNGAKVRTIQAAARAVADGAIPLDGSASFEELDAALLAVPGIGPWTAGYVAMRAFRNPDAFLPTDLGVKHALADIVPSKRRTEIEARAERWRPWRAYALLHLWRSPA
ncbi:MAG: DNA-3-methyladenine glycosylase 2 family protein [Gemmatimonadetes bacterium]|nr:DNA-3-methyladenine glycosylase 2 family protein [Gemmatimonadota bacterium]